MDNKKKLVLMRVLKVFFYLLGFPLLMFLVAKDSMVFFNEELFSKTATKGVWFVFGIWCAFTLIQIALRLTVKKQQIRTVITVVVALLLLIIPIQSFDAITTKKFDTVRTDNATYGATVDTYNRQAQWYNTLSDKSSYSEKLINNVDKFIDVYGLGGYYPTNYRTITQLNTIAVDIDGNLLNDKKALKKVISESGYMYNPNGMLYDGYIFGVENAIELLIEYNEFQKQKFTDDSDKKISVDEALALAIERAETSDKWVEYSTSEKYLANQAEAEKIFITEERLDAILNTLIKGLGQNDDIKLLLNLVGDFLPPEYADLLDIFKETGPEVTLDLVCDLAHTILVSLTNAQVELRDDLLLDPTEEKWAEYDKAVLASQSILPTLESIGITDITPDGLKAGILGLLNEISYYQHPENKMSWDFMTEEDKELGLDRYAWVKYHCEKFGRVSGCVLIATDTPLVGGTIGNGTNADSAYTLEELYQLRADLEYQPEVYPIFSARRYINIWYGIIAISVFFTASFAKKEQDLFNEITAGGNE